MKNEMENMISKIRLEALQNKLIIFIGAGVSNNSGYKSWNQLVKTFDDELGYSQVQDKQYSTDELIKIPQYFFQENQTRYKEILESNYKKLPLNTNPIIDILLKLNPHHIITTNYDCLIEMSLERNNVYGCPVGDDLSKYKVIAKDSDLISAPKSNYLIKMHGDLDNFDSLVLKEDDYLKYSSTHILIETYIKSLLIDHTFLFVGYRIGDYNLKLIMSWVEGIIKKYNDVNGEQRKQHYFINANSQPLNKFEKEYYKDKNILVLEASQAPKEIFESNAHNINHPHGINLYNVCRYINEGNIDNKNIDEIYDSLLFLGDIDAITANDLLTVLGSFKPWDAKLGNVYSYNPNYISQLLRECIYLFENHESTEKIEFVKKLFLKSRITTLHDAFNGNNIYLGKCNNPPITNLMFNFDFNGIQQFRDSLASSTNSIDILKYTYLQCYFAGRDDSLKEQMQNLVSAFKESKDYFYLIIIEHNLFVTNQSDTARYKIIADVLPEDIKKKYTTLLEYLNGFEALYYEVSKLKTDTFNMFSPYYYQISQEFGEKNSHYKKLKTYINDILVYLFDNYIIANRYYGVNCMISKLHDILKEYVDLSLCFVSPNSKMRIVNEQTGEQYERTLLNKNDFFIAIYYLEPEYLEFLINKHGISNINLNKDEEEYIIKSFVNMVNSLDFVFPLNPSKTVDILENFLIIINKVTFEDNKYKLIFQHTICILDKIIGINNNYDYSMCFNFTRSLFEYISDFLRIHCDLVPKNILITFIESFIVKFMNENPEQANYYIGFINDHHLIGNLANFIKYYYSGRLSSGISSEFITSTKQKYPAFYYDIIIQVYPILDLNMCKEINNSLSININSLSPELLYSGLLNEAIKYDEIVERHFVKLCRDNIMHKSKDQFMPSNPLYTITRLAEREVIKDLSPFREFCGEFSFFDFVCFPEEFDFQQFDVAWSSWLTLERYVNIGIELAYDILLNKYKSAMENGPTEIVKVIYYKYFHDTNIDL